MKDQLKKFEEEYRDYESNWNEMSRFKKILVTMHLNLSGLIRADITTCPNCGHTTLAMKYGVTSFGYTFMTKCHRCGHIFSWNESML